MTSSVHRTQPTCVLFFPPVIYHNSQVTNSIGMEKNEWIWEVNEISLNAEDLCFISQHIIQVRLNICPICQRTSECPMQRTMLVAVHASEEWLIAPWYMIQISAHSIFFHRTRTVRFIMHLSPYIKYISKWNWFTFIFLQYNNGTLFATWRFQRQRHVFNVYKWRHSDVIVIKLTAATQN